ncbi:response regulator [Vibrio variabilis]|uniref:response regulator n=1 Tax=Vibrio variabilis TaxID=990271 RepID=UPI001EFA0BB1|nr:HD domain-containing phosphohydrolase [Vibrio variabilis]
MIEQAKILIVDDTELNIDVLVETLGEQYDLRVALDGEAALDIASAESLDLILLDIMMPGMDGYEVCTRLKQSSETAMIPVIFLTAMDREQDEAKGLGLGAVDYITKPFSPDLVRARIATHLSLYHHRMHLEELVTLRTKQIQESYIDTIHRLTVTAEYKDEETGAHIQRVSHYCKLLAEKLGKDAEYCDCIFYAAPMHDIGKVGIPEAILLKPGALTEEEWHVMKTHTLIGADILKQAKSPYLQMAADIAAGHHERWDGTGYPNGIQGEKIPLSARILNLADQYDALRSTRPYKPALSHEQVVSIITEGDGRTKPEHFDPKILKIFKACHEEMNQIFDSMSSDDVS